jgi:uncharacterized protein (TIGR02996 family)
MIVANPHDDVPRLIFADFLEESGEPESMARAHYIRAQIEIESTDPNSARGRELAALVERIQEMFLEEFQYELPLWLIEECEFAYRRGFLDHVRMDLTRFTAEGRNLFEHFPILGMHLTSSYGMTITQTPTENWFNRYPFLERLTALGVGPYFQALVPQLEPGDRDESEMGSYFEESLMTTPILGRLQSLNLTGNRISNGWLVRFVSRLETAAFASTLRELDLTDCLLIDNAGANVLATARSLDRIERLNLKNIQFNDATRAMLRRRFGSRVAF